MKLKNHSVYSTKFASVFPMMTLHFILFHISKWVCHIWNMKENYTMKQSLKHRSVKLMKTTNWKEMKQALMNRQTWLFLHRKINEVKQFPHQMKKVKINLSLNLIIFHLHTNHTHGTTILKCLISTTESSVKYVSLSTPTYLLTLLILIFWRVSAVSHDILVIKTKYLL